MSKYALHLIRENIARHQRGADATSLDLGNCGLTQVPTEIGELEWLEELILSDEWDEYDFEKKEWQQMESKNNGNANQIKILPPSLSKLQLLKKIVFSETVVSDLNPLQELSKLQILYCSSTQVSDLNPIRGMNKLQILDCYNTQVSDLSPIRGMNKLQILDCSYTKVSDLGPIRGMNNLRILDCENTDVSDLSPLIPFIQKGIIVTMNGYPSDGEFDFQHCIITNPPPEIVEQGNEAILDYFDQIEKQGGVQTLDEAKLIIVGEGKTGKTTLYHKLINPTYDVLANPTDETHGINTYEGLEIKAGFRANLWDFGGQELQYMTHQFFLSPRALYVLVMDARVESPNLPYWFRIISLLGKDQSDEKVSLLLVLNKRRGSTGRPQYEDLLKIYAEDFDVEFFEVDFAENDERWAALQAAIVRRLEGLPIVKNQLPKQWSPIRDALRTESEKRPHISAERLHEICAPFGVDEERDQWLMTGYLHQLGSLLHFQNDETLMDTVVLKTQWAVEGVYTTLKNENIAARNGRFTKEDLFQTLAEKGYSQSDCAKVLRLMSKNNFDICYPSKSDTHYVAAQLLPNDRPVLFRWHKAVGALQFRYQYSIMPKGLMSRLIVRLSGYLEVLEGCEIVWKKGAVLRIPVNDSECRVLMFEDEDSKSGLKQIAVEVLEDKAPFQNRKYALQEVRKEVESLHERWFRNIQFEQLIPCNCEQCKASTEPFTFLLSDLQKLTKGKAFCNVLEDFVPVPQLLEGVYQQEEIQQMNRGERGREYRERPLQVNVHIENNPQVTVTNQNTNLQQSDLAAIEQLLAKLDDTRRAALKNYVECLPEPETPEEKTSLGKSIIRWLDKNAEGITANVSASVYYEVLKHLFGF